MLQGPQGEHSGLSLAWVALESLPGQQEMHLGRCLASLPEGWLRASSMGCMRPGRTVKSPPAPVSVPLLAGPEHSHAMGTV